MSAQPHAVGQKDAGEFFLSIIKFNSSQRIRTFFRGIGTGRVHISELCNLVAPLV